MKLERHGIAGAKKLATICTDIQSVLVTDGNKQVELHLTANSYPAGLTPEQARFIAKMLNESAGRVEKQQ